MPFLQYIWGKRRFLYVFAVIVAALYLGCYMYHTVFSHTVVVSYIYPNSEKGQYPDGTRLNAYDILSDDVLAVAVSEYNRSVGYEDLNIEEVRSHISVLEYLSPAVQEKVQKARENGEDYSYFVNEFSVTCRPINVFDIKDYRHLFGLLPKADNADLMQKIYDSYLYYFMNHHTEMNIIPRMTMIKDYSGYDYLEIADVFHDNTNMTIKYLEAKNDENGAFVSMRTGMTFSDLIVGLQSMQTLQISKLKAFVSASVLSKNADELINKLKAKNELDMVHYNKLQSESDVSRTAMEQYDHTFEENIVITGVDEQNGLYQARPKTAYDTVTKRALDKGVDAQNQLKDIEENNRLIQQYQTVTHTPDEYAALCAQADQMVDELREKNNELIASASLTVEDYLKEKGSDYLRYNPRGKQYVSVSMVSGLALAFIASLLLGIVLCIALDVYRHTKKVYISRIREQHKKEARLRWLSKLQKGQKINKDSGEVADDDH